MADQDDDNPWDKKLEGKASPEIGVSKDVVRAARAMNPALQQEGSTTELLTKMKGAKQAAAAGQPLSAPGAKDFAANFYAIEQKYKAGRKEVQDQIDALQKKLKDFGPTALEAVITLVVEVDTNMTSAVTKEVMQSETAFLNEIGFTVRKVIDRGLKKKKP